MMAVYDTDLFGHEEPSLSGYLRAAVPRRPPNEPLALGVAPTPLPALNLPGRCSSYYQEGSCPNAPLRRGWNRIQPEIPLQKELAGLLSFLPASVLTDSCL